MTAAEPAAARQDRFDPDLSQAGQALLGGGLPTITLVEE